MIALSLNPSAEIYITSAMPKLIITGASASALKITVKTSEKRKVFETWLDIPDYFEFDLRSIIETDLKANLTPCEKYQVSITHDKPGEPQQGRTVSVSFLAVYSSGAMPESQQILESRFLTLSDSKLIPASGAFDTLTAVLEEDTQGTIEVTYRQGETLATDSSLKIEGTAGCTRFDLDFVQIFSQILGEAAEGIEPVSAVVTIGDRVMRYYFADLQPSAVVSYINTFLCQEQFWMFGSWKRKGKISQQTAKVDGLVTSASIDVTPEFELLTHPLTFRKSYIIPEICMSRSVWVCLYAQESPLALAAFEAVPVTKGSSSGMSSLTFKAVPTEASLESSPQDTEESVYTLKLIASDNSKALGFNFELPRIFTKHFELSFK